MSSPSLVIAERADIHKSCKSIELLVNAFNDYCQVVDALAAVQKKLAKALRESASAKATASIPASALLTSATIFDALAEVDSKFAKLADKECESISGEVRKWFKKLAKEEKLHDDKMASANAKIKQAGQLYEKKSKKNPRDAQEEHTRYVTLLSVLGPEVSQEKYNHSLSVTKRHTAILHTVASSLSKVADAEWLGEWRSLCDGGWAGPIPSDLPNPEPAPSVPSAEKEVDTAELTLDRPAPEYTSRGPSEQERTRQSQDPSSAQHIATTAPPPPQYTSPELQSEVGGTMQSRERIRASLASFPAPPTHFPLPPVTGTPPHTPTNTGSTDSWHDQLEVIQETAADPTTPRQNLGTSLSSRPRFDHARQAASPAKSSPSPIHDSPSAPNDTSESANNTARDTRLTTTPQLFDSSPLTESPNPSMQNIQQQATEDSHTTEFGASRNGATEQTSESPRAIERTDTGKSNGSVVAALRDRYARSPSSNPSPGSSPKEPVRLPLSVSSLATRYSVNGDASPAPRSPERRRVSTDRQARSPNQPTSERALPSVKPIATGMSSADGASVAKRHTLDIEDQRLGERERQLRQREEEIARQQQELEYERLRIQRDRDSEPRPVDFPDHGRYASRPLSQVSSPSTRPVHQLQSYSTTNLAASSKPPTPTQYSPRPSPIQSPMVTPGHAASCGCDSCSASKYRNREVFPSAYDLRPPEPPITLRPEKPKGWIRRLSMPVMANAFSSDSKKGISNLAINTHSPGPYRNSLALPDEAGRLRYDMAGTRNRSSTTLGR
ncbi:hypothetical protein BXZ70DRAFT_1010307 [Cristinia sonorae]|uniref:IMD domain-containing protein n=1 Tax=Cristinia sonorae TaxID=1940300 RepID=A0A8K0UJM2_9AGAR|nr:hypothetical protein BXZ70DRAFT_1010307 [Cristinia sonorae]